MRNKFAAIFFALLALPVIAGEILVYEGSHFRGRGYTLQQAYPNLATLGMANAISSVVVKSGTWELCAARNYAGRCQTFNVGQYPTLQRANDRIESLREVSFRPPPPVTGGYGAGTPEVTLFEHDEFRGASITLRGPTPNLEPLRFNDVTSSLIVTAGSWELCAHANYGPPCHVFNAGKHRSVGGERNDQFSSARPVAERAPGVPAPGAAALAPDKNPKVSVILFSRTGFQGNAKTIGGMVENFDAIDFNDAASSVIVLQGNWRLCTDAYFRGECRTLGPGEYHQLPYPLSDRISSAVPAGPGHAGTTGASGISDMVRGVAVTIFEYGEFGGRSLDINGAVDNLDRARFNDRASSIIIESGDWEFCTDAGYRGRCRTLGPGRYTALPQGMDSEISSVRPR